jgi:Protein of unknown function (DUF3108)
MRGGGGVSSAPAGACLVAPVLRSMAWRMRGKPVVPRPILGLAALAACVASTGAAAAAPFLARYEVTAGGMTVMRVEALFDLEGPGYRIEARIRTAGLGGLFSGGDQVASVEGRWHGNQPVPLRFRNEGAWRGGRRHVAMDYGAAGAPPVLRALEPPREPEREPVPEDLRRGTMDTLSAIAKLTRAVARTARCDGEAATFDGRRRTDFVVRTAGVERVPPHPGFGGGDALRCALESRLIAGRHAAQDPSEAGRPQPATAWLARVGPVPTPVPVRIELPSRWLGAVRVVLVGLELAGDRGGPGSLAAAAARDKPVQQGR